MSKLSYMKPILPVRPTRRAIENKSLYSFQVFSSFLVCFQRNPAASFGEVSKHVAAMWDGMDPDSKGAYKRRTEQAKKEYLRQLASYRATLVSKGNTLESPYNGKGLDVTKVGEDRTYLMNPR